MNERSDLNRRSFMKKTALTASAITLLASGVGLGNEGSVTASASVSATASYSASTVLYCEKNGVQANPQSTCSWQTAVITITSGPYPPDDHYLRYSYRECHNANCDQKLGVGNVERV